jgi:hypothetical protein
MSDVRIGNKDFTCAEENNALDRYAKYALFQ